MSNSSKHVKNNILLRALHDRLLPECALPNDGSWSSIVLSKKKGTMKGPLRNQDSRTAKRDQN
jgi:hypothetical protein